MATLFGETYDWKRAVFDFNGSQLIVHAGPRMDYLEFGKLFPDAKQCDGFGFDVAGGKSFVCYQEDCYDPPLYVVRAEDYEDAVDSFLEHVPGARMSLEDVAEREGDTVGTTGCGRFHYDNEITKVRTIKLVRVEF